MATQISSRDTVALRTAAGHRLRSDAAASWDRLSDAIAARYGWRPAPTDSWRSVAVQESIFRQRYQTTPIQYAAGKTDRRLWDGRYWYRKPGTAAAAVPGTSNHGGGTAVDAGPGVNSYTHARWAQFASLAGAHGWDNTEGKTVNEPWHWVHNPRNDRYAGTTPATSQEDDMTPEQDAMLREVRDTLGARGGQGLTVEDTVLHRLREMGGVLYQGTPGTPRPYTVYDRLVDVQMALTNAIPQLLTQPDLDPDAIAAAIAAAVPADIAAQVATELGTRISGGDK